MTEEYFKKHVLNCNKCGSKPLLVSDSSVLSKTDEEKYRVICWTCKWDCGEHGNKTGLCKTPESALKSWNKHFGL